MKKLIPIVIAFFLISCGGGSDKSTAKTNTTVACEDNISSHGPVDQNSIKIAVNKRTYDIDLNARVVPAENIIVQLDNQGPCIRTNKDGFVTFSALNVEPHEVHIFSPTGFQWVSEYNILPGTVKKYNIGFDVTKNIKTFRNVILKGSITNINPDSEVEILIFYPNGSYNIFSTTIINNSYSANIFPPTTPNQILNTDIIVIEYKYNVTTGKSMVIDSKSFKNVNILTSATETTTTILDVTLSLPKPQPSNILSISSMTVPTDFEIKSFSVNGYSIPYEITSTKPFFAFNYQSTNQDIPQLNPTFPLNFNSYDQFNSSGYRLDLRATSKISNLSWRYLRVYLASAGTGPYTVSPKITVFPNLTSNQTGNIINWNKVDKNLSQQIIAFKSKNGTITWQILLSPSATSVTLPKIPTGIASRLYKNQYIELYGKIKTPADYEFEEYRLFFSSWSP